MMRRRWTTLLEDETRVKEQTIRIFTERAAADAYNKKLEAALTDVEPAIISTILLSMLTIKTNNADPQEEFEEIKIYGLKHTAATVLSEFKQLENERKSVLERLEEMVALVSGSQR